MNYFQLELSTYYLIRCLSFFSSRLYFLWMQSMLLCMCFVETSNHSLCECMIRFVCILSELHYILTVHFVWSMCPWPTKLLHSMFSFEIHFGGVSEEQTHIFIHWFVCNLLNLLIITFNKSKNICELFAELPLSPTQIHRFDRSSRAAHCSKTAINSNRQYERSNIRAHQNWTENTSLSHCTMDCTLDISKLTDQLSWRVFENRKLL